MLRRAFYIILILLPIHALADVLPNLDITPGIARTTLTIKQICKTKWGLDKRHVTVAMKREVEQAYNFKPSDCPSGRVEIDHLISRELGGADDVKNLWPECYEKKVPGKHPSQVKEWGAYKKDRLENRLHKEMCAGHISLKAAREAEINDWRVAYKKYYGEP